MVSRRVPIRMALSIAQGALRVVTNSGGRCKKTVKGGREPARRRPLGQVEEFLLGTPAQPALGIGALGEGPDLADPRRDDADQVQGVLADVIGDEDRGVSDLRLRAQGHEEFAEAIYVLGEEIDGHFLRVDEQRKVHDALLRGGEDHFFHLAKGHPPDETDEEPLFFAINFGGELHRG